MTQFVVDLLGTPVELDVPPLLDGPLTDALTDLGRSDAPVRTLTLEPDRAGHFTLLDGTERVLESVPVDVAVATVVWRLNAIAAASPDHLVVHAGCVADDRGGIILPGRSGSGKSWLTAAFVEHGFDYLSDEHALVELSSGRLVPLAKPLDLGVRGLVPASRLRPGSVGDPGPPAAIVFPRRDGASPTIVSSLDPATSLLALCGQCPSLEAMGATGFRWLAGLASACPAWQITYSEAVEAVEALGATFRDVPRGTALEVVRPVPVDHVVTDATTTVVIDDDVVVFDARTTRVHHLNRSAGFVWLCVERTPDLCELARTVQAEAPAGAIEPADVYLTIEHLGAIGLLDDEIPPDPEGPV